jgi:exodeoxyribonuclease VII large subunit
LSIDSQDRPCRLQTVSELTARVRFLLESEFSEVAVIGEISNAKAHSSGHWYFSLKDPDATLTCACFRSVNAGIKFELQDGLAVVARGRLSVYPPKGNYQLIVHGLEPVGVGAFQLAFEQLKERLTAEGLLAVERKRAIPMLPGAIGVVTSLAGAAVHDILTALARRNSCVRVVISPARVQGEGSPEEVARAIEEVGKLPGIDVILVARGGGAIEDLWAFNSEIVARAVANAPVPVISGVGHETDVTICDLVADLRAPTPTAAAELVAAGHAHLLERWGSLKACLFLGVSQHLACARRRLLGLSPKHALAREQERLVRVRLVLSGYNQRLAHATRRRLAEAGHRLKTSKEKLLSLGLLNTLARGFAILRRMDGTLVMDSTQIAAGERLEAFLKRGKLTLRVEASLPDWSSAPAEPAEEPT